MKIAATVSRYLLGILFTVFGLNGFLHFILQPSPPNPVALEFLSVVTGSHYMAMVFVVQIIGGILLLFGRFVPLALAILGPVVVNILDYHITMDPGGISRGLLATTLWIIVFLCHRSSFSQIFQPHPIDTPARRGITFPRGLGILVTEASSGKSVNPIESHREERAQ